MSDPQPNQGPTGGLTPHLTIPSKGGLAAIEFYGRAFGAEEIMRMPAEDGERLMHAHLRINGASLMLADEFPEWTGEADVEPKAVTLHLQVDDPDEWWTRALVAGAVPVMPLEDQFWGDRYGQVRDPFGHTWSIGGPKPDRPLLPMGGQKRSADAPYGNRPVSLRPPRTITSSDPRCARPRAATEVAGRPST